MVIIKPDEAGKNYFFLTAFFIYYPAVLKAQGYRFCCDRAISTGSAGRSLL
jgi:hypothetical protein